MDKENKNVPEANEEEMEFTADLITLTDEDGEDHEFELVDTLEHNGKSYVALVTSAENPDEMLEDDGNLVIMKIIEEKDGDDILELIEDDDEFEEISDIFMDRLSDMYEFDESGDAE